MTTYERIRPWWALWWFAVSTPGHEMWLHPVIVVKSLYLNCKISLAIWMNGKL